MNLESRPLKHTRNTSEGDTQETLLRVMDIFISLTVVMASQVYTYQNLTVQFKYVYLHVNHTSIKLLENLLKPT